MLGAVTLAVLLSGCHMAWILEDPVPPVPDVTIGPPTPTPTPTPSPEPDPHAYSGKVAKKATCVTLKADQLARVQEVGGVGGAITYSRGSMVRSSENWWAVAVMTQVHPNQSGHTRESVPEQHFFVIAAESARWDELATAYQVAGSPTDDALRKAAGCARKLPLPKPKLEPTDARTYTGKLAKGAKCRAASDELLAQLEQVGQVGGAVTYPRGQLVRANGHWWTVAVATQVNANSAGLTREDVPLTELFVTNAPSATKDAKVVSFPINVGKKDAAAAKALGCLDAE